MAPQLIAILLGAATTAFGAFIQWVLAAMTQRREYHRQQIADWGENLAELMDASHAVNRFASETRDVGATAALEARLDDAFNRVLLTCPLELTRPATQYVRFPNALLRGKTVNDDAYDGAEQELTLVFRRVSDVNQSLPWWHRGARARKDISPQQG